MHLKSRSQKTATELRDFFFTQLKDGDVEVSRRACAVFIELYRQDIWRDARVVNLVSAGLLHPDTKISAALAHLFLGNKMKTRASRVSRVCLVRRRPRTVRSGSSGRRKTRSGSTLAKIKRKPPPASVSWRSTC